MMQPTTMQQRNKGVPMVLLGLPKSLTALPTMASKMLLDFVDPVVQLLPFKSQVIKIDPGVTVEVEKFQGQIFKGGRFSALMNLEEAEDIDAYLVDEKNLAMSENCRDGQSVMEANMEYNAIVKKELADYSVKWKETQIEDFLHVDAMGKAAGSSSVVDASISSASSFEP